MYAKIATIKAATAMQLDITKGSQKRKDSVFSFFKDFFWKVRYALPYLDNSHIPPSVMPNQVEFSLIAGRSREVFRNALYSSRDNNTLSRFANLLKIVCCSSVKTISFFVTYKDIIWLFFLRYC